MIKNLFLPIIFILFAQSIFAQGFNMTLEGSWDNTSYEFNDCWGYTDDFGNEYAIVGSRTRVIFFDITTPTAPVLLGEFTGAFPGIGAANSIWRDFKTYDKYAYAVADQGSEGLMVFDLSDIHNGNITKVWQDNSVFGRAHNVFIDVPQGKLYAIGSNTQNNGLIVFDIKDDPSAPVHLASTPVAGGYLHDAYIINNIAYCSSGYDGLYVIDMTVPSSPVLKSSSLSLNNGIGYNHSGWPFDNGDKMIVAEEVPIGLRLAIFDISNQNSIQPVSEFRDPINTGVSGFTTYHNPYVVGDYAVISSYEDGITIMDLSNSNAPFRAAHYDTYLSNTGYNGYEGCWGAYPYFPSGTIIGSDISTGLYILSTSLNMTNTCSNGVKDDFEIDVDCGGFCNTCDCSSPRDIVFSENGNSILTIDWTVAGGATGYEVRYREQGTSAWTSVSSASNTVNISNLSSLVTFEFQLRSDCGNRLTPYGSILTYSFGNCNSIEEYSGTQTSGVYFSENLIRSEAIIQSGSDVEYLTGEIIELESPFTVGLNTTFTADINRPCLAVATSIGQNHAQNTALAQPSEPNDPFTLVVNNDENIVYLVCNDITKGDFQIDIKDQEGNSIQKNEKTYESKLLKFPITSDFDKFFIQQGNETYILTIE